jgi:phosphoribosylformylglycinamidine synthase
MYLFQGALALSPFRIQRLENQIQTLLPHVTSLDAKFIFLAWFKSPATREQLECLANLVGGTQINQLVADSSGASVFVTPRIGTLSPWSSKATEIGRNCGLSELDRLERITHWSFGGVRKLDNSIVAPIIHDPMTQTLLSDIQDTESLEEHPPSSPLRVIELASRGSTALEIANDDLGLALADEEVAYLVAQYAELGRDPTDIELMMFAQANSEHCRHKIFNADWKLDGNQQDHTLFEMVRHTHSCAPNKVLSAYTDNSAVTTGFLAERFFADPTSGSYTTSREDAHILMKVETHNHPTGISPYAGAATGSGGEIRDEGATGRGAKPKAGLTGFSVSHLRIPGFERPWEFERPMNPRLASAFNIMLEAPIGAAAFNNEFGRPAITGYFRVFEDHSVTGDSRGYDKPIMLAGGCGNIRDIHVHKLNIPSSTKIIVLGGPAMMIGLGGGAASSMDAGTSEADLDFASVQRDNPEMERRCQEVINCCWALGPVNPILSIHDVGAGGLSNAVPEILHDCGRGGKFELRDIPNADPSMSPLAIWCNEAQERYVVAIEESRVSDFQALCSRERCPAAIIGEATEREQLVVFDRSTGANVIDLPMDVIFGKTPKMFRDVCSIERHAKVFNFENIYLDEALERVLSHPTVADKRFLITIGDRNVGGLSSRDQMVGPWQTPVADCAVTASGFGSKTGEAMAIGERTPVAVLDAPASGRLAIGEAVTNIAAARIMQLSDIVLSANWMAAAGHPGEDAQLFETVKAVAFELCPALGITIPVGKDSMSMKSQWDNDGAVYSVTSPVSLIVSAFAPVVDIEHTITPDLKRVDDETCILFVDLADGQQRLGGSILSQCYGEIGSTPADLVAPAVLREFFIAIQLLNENGYLLAYHDRSDGGLISTLCEMAFAGRCGIDVDVSALGEQSIPALFCEELGVVIQIRERDLNEVLACLRQSSVLDKAVYVLGKPTQPRQVKIRHLEVSLLEANLSDLLEKWSANSFHMQRARDNPTCAIQEREVILDENDPGLHLETTFDKTPRTTLPLTSRPKVAILREQGVNGHVEMAAAFDRAGFEAVDVHMSDLIDRARPLDEFNGLVACGGFSYGDVLGAGGGWAKSILFNERVRESFRDFFSRPTTFTLGVCNGCQMLSHLHELIPGANAWPRFERNLSEQFEARLVMVEVIESSSILLRDMAGTRAPIVVAHGEGRVATDVADQQFTTCLRFVDNKGATTERYPYNPNGSIAGVTGLSSDDGRVTIMMPHPERVFLRSQYSWLDPSWTSDEGPWMKMFHNARTWLN